MSTQIFLPYNIHAFPMNPFPFPGIRVWNKTFFDRRGPALLFPYFKVTEVKPKVIPGVKFESILF